MPVIPDAPIHRNRSNAGGNPVFVIIFFQCAADILKKSAELFLQDFLRHRIADKNHEFIPAKPACDILFSEGFGQTLREFLKGPVSLRMSFKIIDLFKIIQVKKDQRPARMLFFQKCFCPAFKAISVVQACKRIIIRLCPCDRKLIFHPVHSL